MQTNQKLAEKWGCNAKTIQRWREQGAPLANAARMRQWLATRKNLPPGTARLSSPKPAPPMATADNQEGAGATHRRLCATELELYRAYQAAVDSGDPLYANAARKAWLAVSEQVRRADCALEEHRRETGELISRAHAEHMLALFEHFFFAAWNDAARIAASEIQRNPADAFSIIEQKLHCRCMLAATSGTLAAAPDIPQWAVHAFTRGWRTRWCKTDCKARVEAIAAHLQKLAETAS